jgi:transposase-like protein
MTSTFHPKATMTAANELPDPALPIGADTEVVGRARRRVFSNADKRRILSAADHCTKPGELGALLRREGVYSSSLSTWRRQREERELAALAPQQRGPKVDPHRGETLHIAQLTRENEKLKRQLSNAMLVIDVQKKLSALMGYTLDENGERI